MTLDSFLQGYTFAYLFWLGLTLGCVGVMLLHHTVQAKWGLPILRVLEAGTKLVPVMAIGFLPIVYGAFTGHIFPWADASWVARDHVLQHRQGYYSPVFFAVRALLYFAFWWWITYALTRSSDKQDKNGDPEEAQKRVNWAAPAIVAHVLIVTSAYTDWVMSLDAHWFSTLLGAWFIVGHGLAALSFGTIVVLWNNSKGRQPYVSVVNKTILRDLGNMMLGFTMLWGYFTLSQFLIIWSGNLPEETGYYAVRMRLDWNALTGMVVFGQFFIPFFALLLNHTKRQAGPLLTAACIIFAVRILDIYCTIIPFFNRKDAEVNPMTLLLPSALCFVVVGGVWLALFNTIYRSRPVMPSYDPRLQADTGHGVEGQEAISHA